MTLAIPNSAVTSSFDRDSLTADHQENARIDDRVAMMVERAQPAWWVVEASGWERRYVGT